MKNMLKKFNILKNKLVLRKMLIRIVLNSYRVPIKLLINSKKCWDMNKELILSWRLKLLIRVIKLLPFLISMKNKSLMLRIWFQSKMKNFEDLVQLCWSMMPISLDSKLSISYHWITKKRYKDSRKKLIGKMQNWYSQRHEINYLKIKMNFWTMKWRN